MDEDILNLIAGDEEASELDIVSEVEEAGRISSEAKSMARKLRQKIDGNCASENRMNSSLRSDGGASVTNRTVCAKLPKLHVKRFNGNVCEWQEFWDSFESAIHGNGSLSDVDKFNYLRGLLGEPAKSCIAGYSLTSANYNAAIDALKERYGKPESVQRAHMQKLLNLDRVKDPRDITSLRHLCDSVEAHHRGLDALGVDSATYSSIVVPYVLNLIPESIRLLITRGENFHQWDMDDMLRALKCEVELREEHRVQREQRERHGDPEKSSNGARRNDTKTASALLTKSGPVRCAFCLGCHRHEECEKIKSIEERKNIIKKYGRCYICLEKGHMARDCDNNIKCSICKKNHHKALCDSGKESKPQGTVGQGSPKNSCEKAGCNVALQTAQAKLVGSKSGRVRVLLDSGSQRSFVTERTAKALGCKVVREENLRIGTFGKRALENELRRVVRLDLSSLSGGEVVSIEAYVVPEISVISNQHLEVVRNNFEHLKGLWLSDVCKVNEELEVNVLVGADYLWSLQKGRIMRGKQGEPVAIETVLGWVVSGPVGSTDKNQPATAQVNFCSANKTCINVENFWDLESLGIKDKEGHDPLPTNYDLSLKRMKGQIRRLGKNPELLKEYDTIIKAQEELGIIERVGKDSVINSHAKIHYMPHQAVVRKDAKTTKCDREFSEKKSFYVDDLASGESSTERAYQLYRKANERMNEGGFKLRKWRTNDSALRSQIEEDVRDVESSCVDEQTYAKTTLAQVQGQFGKVLGLEWDSVGDVIIFDFENLSAKAENTEPTKRNVLSLLACIFDPLGLLSPTIVKAKILFQDICYSGVDWDDTLPKSVKEKWEKWLRDLKEVKSVSIGRYSSGVTDTSGSESKQRYFLHGFGDASKRAYCAVVYLVVLNGNDVRVKLIASKTRVAPMKELSIPRLELMAARILAHLMSAVRKALESEYNFEGVKYWTDSMTVLYWIVNSGNWKQFVQHRVDEILRLSSKTEWSHCPGKENPADLGSRGVLMTELKNAEVWWSGPSWLRGSPRHYPMVKEIVPTVDSKVEEKRSFVVNLIISARSLFGIGNVISISKYSTLTRLLRVTAWVKRFVYNLKQKKLGLEIFTGPIKASEMNDGECEWIKSAQLELREQPEFKQLERQYGLIEMNGILHCTGRLGESDLEAEAREPIVLPRRQYFTELVIRQCHESVMHGGVRSTLAQLRSKYWVPKGRQEVKRVSGGCVACKRWNSKPCTQIKQAALPEFRVRRAAPFENSGVDFAGPLYVKQRQGKGEWKTGVIQELICGKDKVVRGARVCVMTNGRRQVLNRAIQHLYPVEVKDESKVEGVVKEDIVSGCKEKTKRKAALDARWKSERLCRLFIANKLHKTNRIRVQINFLDELSEFCDKWIGKLSKAIAPFRNMRLLEGNRTSTG
ncbi:uncharacterized protein LOC124456335 [Xenia sp. Carnegie-2017]|uniref:uncharacterized protein LOC124456335 n=1 Tax=Xenia sp. Carnegie-2017 TaxID=2897299 RepID=UPI001F04EA5A|nr:uncharacterized protein LOC124456335 [Xenia sp. Carnegie-2017]